ncbi:hypothetical protein KRM28CT15_25490 [Krasilnikovia sp. M28-CT-15]
MRPRRRPLAIVDVAQRCLTLHIVSATDEHGTIQLLTPADAGTAIADRVTRLSAELGTTVVAHDTHLDVEWPIRERPDSAQEDPVAFGRVDVGGSGNQ